MIEWRDTGYVIEVAAHGETSAVASVFTRAHGRHAGLVHGGRGRRMRPVLQIGNGVAVTWSARLSDQLGRFRLELTDAIAGRALDDPLKLAGLTTMAALARLLPEREPQPDLFEALEIALEHLETADLWPALLVRWELALLDAQGFALELSTCAVSGTSEALTYVSPRTGRAVSRAAGAPYADRLLTLPAFLAPRSASAPVPDLPGPEEVLAGFALTEHFIVRHLLEGDAARLPAARQRLKSALAKRA